MASDPDLAKDVMSCLQVKVIVQLYDRFSSSLCSVEVRQRNVPICSQISQDSIGPKHICNECYDRVQDWIMFKKQSEEALKEIESNSSLTEKEVCFEGLFL